MKNLSNILAVLLVILLSSNAIADNIKPIIENKQADKSTVCWTMKVQLNSIFVDVTTASDNIDRLGFGLTLEANPASALGGVEVDTRFSGSVTVLYRATDKAGNTTTQCIRYVIRDYIDSNNGSTLGIADDKKIITNIYPNPVKDILFIDTKLNLSTTHLKIFNTLGKDISCNVNRTNEGYSISVASLAKGIYFLQIQTKKEMHCERIIIE